jgi:hypothetical protein
MGTQFSRQYRAALLDFLLHDNEAGLEHAYALGRRAVEAGIGLLQLMAIHHESIDATIGSARTNEDLTRCLHNAQRFLLEVLAPFDMAYRGFMDRIHEPWRVR